jgi:heptosyltransferase-2
VKILIRATNWIGDAVMSLPALRAIRRKFPEAKITALAKPWVADLYAGESSIDRVIPLQGGGGLRDFGIKRNLIRRLRAEAFDLAILLPNSFESAAIVRLAGVRRIVGYARDGRSLLLTDAIARPRPGDLPQHERYYYLELLQRAGLIDSLPDVPEIRLEGLDEARQRGKRAFEHHDVRLPVVGVSPGAAYGSAKRWLPERFAESAGRLAASLGASIAVFGSDSEKGLCAQVAAVCSGTNLAGSTSLREFIDMTAACSVFLTNDSGAMHIASATGVPSVTVFGPTNEFATGPLGPLARIIRQPVDCAPCMKRECPIDHRCMTRVTPDQVVLIAEELLDSTRHDITN